MAHVSLGHVDKLENETQSIAEENLIEEYDADLFAFERIMKGANNLTNSHTAEVGLVAGLCSILFFSSDMKGGDHPDPDERLKIILEKLNLQPEDNLWGIACVALKLWANHNTVDLEWPTIVDTYSDLFYSTLEVLKRQKSRTPPSS